uniref:Uncharacterized protein n=1 Tax=Podoviridae sp. ctZDN4 TaxID=2825258 RepID=A0A8S5U499_9CAUD|nr:MAG TPA: hypothetical protein [Podoviridae sp. ctZDN4]
MADEKNTDISTPFIFQTSPPYAAPGDHYQYDLYWLVNQLKQALTNTETLRLHDIGQDTRLDGLDILTAQLKDATCQLFAKLKAGDFTKDTFIEWVNTNMTDIIHQMVRFVFFGLDDDGHFVAYIPASWEFLHFDTLLDPDKPGYGHLVVHY